MRVGLAVAPRWLLFILLGLACRTNPTVVGGSGGATGAKPGPGSGGSGLTIDLDASMAHDAALGPVRDPDCQPISCSSGDGGAFYCGLIGDGCNGSQDCGACPDNLVCGAITPNVCGPPTGSCTPTGCEQATGTYCGRIGDGCGRLLDCGDCTGGWTCGGGGLADVCGSTTGCTISNCTISEGQSYCGRIGNGCGGALDCPDCPAGKDCHPTARVCVGACPLCGQVPSCASGTTTITGRVFTGALANPDPVYNALVFIPNRELPELSDAARCDRCTQLTIDQALASTLSAADGSFTLSDVPAGDAIPIVVQLGNWRRRIALQVTACKDNRLADGTLRLPRDQSEGDIPLTAIATGQNDRVECVLRKMGVADSEFTDPTGKGRIHVYQRTGSIIDQDTPAANALYSTATTMQKYNQILLPCADAASPGAGPLANFTTYVNSGGRAFVTDLSYTWLYDNGALGGTVNWVSDPSLDRPGPTSGILNTSFSKGRDFATWLSTVGALTAASPPTIAIQESFFRTTSVAASGGARDWINALLPASVQHFTIETPVAAATSALCGRVIYSSFHVLKGDLDPGIFPSMCDSSMTLSAQEKVLEFMILDLASCIPVDGAPPPPSGPPAPPPPPPPAPVTSCSQGGGPCTKDVDCCSGAGSCYRGVCGVIP